MSPFGTTAPLTTVHYAWLNSINVLELSKLIFWFHRRSCTPSSSCSGRLCHINNTSRKSCEIEKRQISQKGQASSSLVLIEILRRQWGSISRLNRRRYRCWHRNTLVLIPSHWSGCIIDELGKGLWGIYSKQSCWHCDDFCLEQSWCGLVFRFGYRGSWELSAFLGIGKWGRTWGSWIFFGIPRRYSLFILLLVLLEYPGGVYTSIQMFILIKYILFQIWGMSPWIC